MRKGFNPEVSNNGITEDVSALRFEVNRQQNGEKVKNKDVVKIDTRPFLPVEQAENSDLKKLYEALAEFRKGALE